MTGMSSLWIALTSWLFNVTHPRSMPRCRHGFAPDQGIGLWCPACESKDPEGADQ